MANEIEDQAQGSVGAWAKRYYFAVRATMESILRPYDLGSTQYYVLYQLANDGPTMATAVRVLQAATQRLLDHMSERGVE